MSIHIVLHTTALSIKNYITFFDPTSIIISLVCLAKKSLFFIPRDLSFDFKNIGPLRVIAIKLISGHF